MPPRSTPRTRQHLRELLAADHRYVFTLIHKFRLDKNAGETTMPVLSDRSDVIVITDEAHRSQYDTLALNMRQALPNAAFMGFTGTPLIDGEELTREQFGDYVIIYNFRDAIEDGATVPLYYENRIPELQIVNENFADELGEILEEAELDEDAEGQLARRFGKRVHAPHPPRAAADHRQGPGPPLRRPGFTGKAMYVGLDKAAAVRMYDYVSEAWAEHLDELRAQHDALPELERPWLASRIELMETTDMAVVVSQAQNEIARSRRSASTSNRTATDGRRGPGREVQGRRRPAADRVRVRHVDDRFRCAERVDDLPRPPHAQPHADADDRPCQPGLPRQGQRDDRRLHRRVPEPREGPRHLRRGQR